MHPLISLLLLAAAEPGAAAPPLDLAAIAARAKQSVVHLSIESAGGEEQGNGTGFVITPEGVVVTNHHVIDDAERIVAVFADGRRVRVLGVLADQEGPDLALLRLEGAGFPSLALSPGPMPPEGTRVFTIGSPRGFGSSLSEGIVAAVRKQGLERKPGRDNDWMPEGPVVQHTAMIAPGSSGSPLMTMDGAVIGVNQSGYPGELQFAVSVESVRAMVDITDLGAAPRPLANEHPPVARNVIISATLFALLGITFAWPALARRLRRRRLH